MFLKNNYSAVLLSVFFTLLFTACYDKDVELEVIETACKDFFIKNAVYEFSEKPSCGDRQLKVSFEFEGDEDCIHLVNMTPRFFDVNGNELTGFDTTTVQLFKDKNELIISSSTMSFTYCFNHKTDADSLALNYIQFDLHSENEQGNASNTIGMRANIPGSQVKQPSESDFQKEYIVNSRTIKVFVFDDAAEDGDIISINVNNEWLVENKMIFKKGEEITLTIDQLKTNFMLLYAVNEGSDSPNTLAGTIDDGVKVQEFNLNLKTGEQVYFKITYVAPPLTETNP